MAARHENKKRAQRSGGRARVAQPAVLAPAAASSRRARDLRPYIYLGLDQLFVIGYVYVLIDVIPNRLTSAQIHLWVLPVLMQLMAIGMATVFARRESARAFGWWLTLGSASLMVVATVLLIVRVLVSAAFLSGVYGGFGKAAAISALIGVALVVELVALLPLFQIKYLRTRAGRHAFAVT